MKKCNTGLLESIGQAPKEYLNIELSESND